MRTILIVGALITSFISMIVVLPENVIAEEATGYIWFDQCQQDADVGPEDDGIVEFTGGVSINIEENGGDIQKVVVELYPNSSQGWDVIVSPQTMTFDIGMNETEQMFTLTEQVPLGTSHMVFDVIKLSGIGHCYPGNATFDLCPAAIMVTVNQFHNFSLNCSEPYKICKKPGEDLTYTVKIRNDGNGPDIFGIEISNKDELISNGWMLSLSATTVELEASQEDNIIVKIKSPNQISDGTYEIVLRVISKQALSDWNILIQKSCSLYAEIDYNSILQRDIMPSNDTKGNVGTEKGFIPTFEALFLLGEY
jgi:hypothetical protein